MVLSYYFSGLCPQILSAINLRVGEPSDSRIFPAAPFILVMKFTCRLAHAQSLAVHSSLLMPFIRTMARAESRPDLIGLPLAPALDASLRDRPASLPVSESIKPSNSFGTHIHKALPLFVKFVLLLLILVLVFGGVMLLTSVILE